MSHRVTVWMWMNIILINLCVETEYTRHGRIITSQLWVFLSCWLCVGNISLVVVAVGSVWCWLCMRRQYPNTHTLWLIDADECIALLSMWLVCNEIPEGNPTPKQCQCKRSAPISVCDGEFPYGWTVAVVMHRNDRAPHATCCTTSWCWHF